MAVLSVGLDPAGHDRAGIPWLDFQEAGCTFCAACAEACPVEVERFGSGIPAPRIGDLKLNRETCLAWNGVICQSCVGPCPVHAPGINRQRQLIIDADLCNGCGMCWESFPTTISPSERTIRKGVHCLNSIKSYHISRKERSNLC